MSTIETRGSIGSSIARFTGAHSFLSNFYPCVVRVSPADLLVDLEDRALEFYRSAEHAYQASKSRDLTIRNRVRDATNPAQAKRLGRRVALRPDWEQVKERVMLAVVRAKFSDPRLAELLLDTGERELIEGNSWGDVEWGVCEGRGGQNKLGKILMVVRGEIRERGREREKEDA